MKNKQKLQYIGKGFIGFNPIYKEMIFISKKNCYYLVYYFDGTKNIKMLVRSSEVKNIQTN